MLVFSLSEVFADASPGETRFNLGIVHDGHYRVAFSDLPGLQGSVPSADLALYETGKRVALRVDDGGDGSFDEGDSLRFVGRHLSGSGTWYNGFSRYNVYQLRLDAADGAPPEAEAPLPTIGVPFEHIEKDTLRLILAHASDPEGTDHWYDRRITHVDGDGVAVPIQWKGAPRRLRLALAGLSRDVHASDARVPQHEVRVSIDGGAATTQNWNGQERVTVEIDTAGLGLEAGETSQLLIEVPARFLDGRPVPIVDAVLLDWIEVEYEDELPPALSVIAARGDSRRLIVEKQSRQPAWIAPVRAANRLRDKHLQADYVMITVAGFRNALEPLADYHRSQGLSVHMTDVQTIYDEFNHGVASPLAIKAFLKHAMTRWRPPAPRFVLLAGDASWMRDPRAPDDRNRVPTLSSFGEDGAAASDNALVALSPRSYRPQLAVGRLPAGNAAELSAMVGKSLRYARAGKAVSWARRSLWISDSDAQFQRISDGLSSSMLARGLTAERIYPEIAAGSAGQDQQRLLRAFDQGSAVLHFLGHGGRFVWRTGPMDLRGATDLFSVDHIDRLKATPAQPLVLSMTCSSGPFDHPEADSMAEALLRQPDRGAIGVIAASRRVPPSKRFSELLIKALVDERLTFGEALLRAKQQERRRTLIESYNLLGDPALRLPEFPPS